MTDLYATIDSPVGELLLTMADGVLTGLSFAGERARPAGREDPDALAPMSSQLDEYFAGSRTTFDLTLGLAGTEFQRRVWQALRVVPYGTTVSYGELARRVGNPRASRAVGLANNRNPIAIIVPCHRVIGADGSLTGYGGGLDRKRWLLDLEAKVAGGRLDG